MDLALLGAQLPDLFYHNRRRRPSGLHLGVVVHKEGAGRLAASMLAADSMDRSQRESLVAGFICHVILDRAVHPWINYVTADSPERADHVMLEEILDACLAGANELPRRVARAARRIADQQEMAEGVLACLVSALHESYPRAGSDERLLLRCSNSLQDAADFWSWRAERGPRGTVPDTACAIALNSRRRRWFSPWDPWTPRTESVSDLTEAATVSAAETIQGMLSAPGELQTLLGNANLSDGQQDGPPLARTASGPEIAAELRTVLGG